MALETETTTLLFDAQSNGKKKTYTPDRILAPRTALSMAADAMFNQLDAELKLTKTEKPGL